MVKIHQAVRSLPGYSILRRVFKSFSAFCPTNEDWARVVMNRETRKIIQSLQPNKLKALEISGKYWGNQESFKSYTTLNFPDFDICESPTEETFDLIIAEQVFEHLLRPYRAGKNVYNMLNDKGYFLITTPFLLRIHNHPTDCSRWTEIGLQYLLAEFGFKMERIQTGSWGNRACIRGNFNCWAKYRPLFHSLRNESDFPVVVWALAQK